MIGALVAAFLSFKFNITLGDVFIGAFFGSIVDLDHVVSHWMQSGKMSLRDTVRVDVTGLEHSRTRWIHGPLGFFTIGIPALIAFYFFGMEYALLIYLPFLAHLFFDFAVPYSNFMKVIYKFGGFLIPVTFEELILDVFTFDILMVALLYFGIIV